MKKTVAVLLAVITIFSCGSLISCGDTSNNFTDPAVTTAGDHVPDEPKTEYMTITVDEYMDKTTAAFLSKLISFTTDYKFVWNKNGTPRVALPDAWFGWCKGSDTPNNPYHQKVAKLLYNESTKKYDLYIADTFGIEVLNLYILRDMYSEFGTITTKTITDGWIKYDVWDMGGGNRSQGAFALAKNYRYIAPFLGASEYGNRYPWCEEPWICNNTIGLVAAGMPETAIEISKIFGSVTGDSDNLLWVDFIAAMYAMAYYESDIPTLIRKAAMLFPDNSYQKYVVDHCFELYEKYPSNWRRAIVEAEKDVFRRCFYYHTDRSNNQQGQVDVNMAFSILGLLYGNGDYEATARVFSLSGYDARGVIFLPILGIIGGMDVIPAEGLDMIWQDGNGEIVNLPVVEEQGIWMHHTGLPERMKLSDIMDMFRTNFESVLFENGGKLEDGTYYIPKTDYLIYDHAEIENSDFESGTLSAFTVMGDVAATEITDYAYLGNSAVKITGSAETSNGIYTTVRSLVPGAKYKMTAYVIASLNATARLFAAKESEEVYQYASVRTQPEFVKREFVFTATAETMRLGCVIEKQEKYGYAIIDEITVMRIEENPADGITASISSSPDSKGAYGNKITFDISGTADRQVYLKLVFANTSNQVFKADVTVNGTSFNAVPFYKTATEITDGMCDTVYIPIVLGKTENKVILDIGNARLHILSAEAVTVNERLIIAK